MLLDGHSSLFLIECRAGLAPSEPNVQVGHFLIENTAAKRRFNFPVPHGLWVEMEIFAKAARQDNATREFTSEFSWNRQPTLVIQLSLEVVHVDLVPLPLLGFCVSEFLMVVVFILVVATHLFPLALL